MDALGFGHCLQARAAMSFPTSVHFCPQNAMAFVSFSFEMKTLKQTQEGGMVGKGRNWKPELRLIEMFAPSILVGCMAHQENHEFVSNCRGVIGGPHWDDKAKTRSANCSGYDARMLLDCILQAPGQTSVTWSVVHKRLESDSCGVRTHALAGTSGQVTPTLASFAICLLCHFLRLSPFHCPLKGLRRNGSASDTRSEGWEFESIWPHFPACQNDTKSPFHGFRHFCPQAH